MLRALEGLADAADEKSVKVVLCGLNVDIYKVLKLARLSPRFSIVN
jgi:anti-anti-sigma regulatory factor